MRPTLSKELLGIVRSFGMLCASSLLVGCLEGVDLESVPLSVDPLNEPVVTIEQTPTHVPEQPQAYDELTALSRLTPATQFTYRFLNDGQIVEEVLPVSNDDITLDEDGNGASLNAAVFIGERLVCRYESTIYLCFRLFPTGAAVFNAFELDASNNQGIGAFEVCPATITLMACTDNFSVSPDGSLSVLSSMLSAAQSSSEDRYNVDAGAYLEYLKQGVTDEPNQLSGLFSIDFFTIDKMLSSNIFY